MAFPIPEAAAAVNYSQEDGASQVRPQPQLLWSIEARVRSGESIQPQERPENDQVRSQFWLYKQKPKSDDDA